MRRAVRVIRPLKLVSNYFFYCVVILPQGEGWIAYYERIRLALTMYCIYRSISVEYIMQ